MHLRTRRIAVTAATVCTLLATATQTPSAAITTVKTDAAPQRSTRIPVAHFMKQRSRHGVPAADRSGGNLVDHGGAVMSVAHTYVVWWGPSTAWAGDVKPGIRRFFAGLRGSTFLSTALQYLRGAPLDFRVGVTRIDPSTPPPSITPDVLGREIGRVFSSGVDPLGVYFVYTSSFPRGARYCAWHSSAVVNSRVIAVAFMPNTGAVTGCDPQVITGRSHPVPSPALRSLVNVTSHELMEVLTDPQPGRATAWVDAHGAEIGDKCAWTFAAPVVLRNHSTWILQSEWSNSSAACVSPH